MRRPGVILLLGLFLCIGAFSGAYYVRTAPSRELMKAPQPELAWMKEEFRLNKAEYERLCGLHEAYLPECARRCRIIEGLNRELEQRLAAPTNVTPEIEALLTQRAKVRSDCETEMLKHFIEVSKTMPAEQGARYLSWVKRQTVLSPQPMEEQHHH
jgi:hypothetical protein